MTDENSYINTKQARELLGITTITLRNWDKENRIKTVRTPSGHRLYSKQDIFNILGRNPPPQEKKKVIYARVSSKKQEDDLQRQIDFLKSKFPLHSLITDVGSGINWKRKGFEAILEQSLSGSISEVVVTHRDRFCRFGFELLEVIFNRLQIKLIVLDREDGKSSREDLADDILSIIHIYSCREMGKRRYSKIKKSKDISNTETKEDV